MNPTRAAARVQRIKQSPSGAAADRAQELKRQGKAIISLVVGEPDFATPAHICQAAWDAMERGDTRYTHNAGTPALREAIVAKLKRENDVSYTLHDIIVTPGAKSAVYLALAATLDPGDEVIIPAPYWVSYPDMVKLCEGEPVIVPCPESDGFKLTPERLAQAITPRSRWLVINSPSNPTGACYTADEYRALAAVLLAHPQLMIMTDEIYEHIRFGAQENPHLLAIAPALRDRTLIINGVSKSYAMTGWRIGFVAGPPDLIKAIAVVKSQTSGATCSISQAAAVAAYEGDQSSLAINRETYRLRQQKALTLINAIDGLSCLPPAGAFYLYVNCRDVIGKRRPDGTPLESDGDVVLYLLEHAEVAGAAYGLSPYFRISIATDLDTIETGIARIARALSQLR